MILTQHVHQYLENNSKPPSIQPRTDLRKIGLPNYLRPPSRVKRTARGCEYSAHCAWSFFRSTPQLAPHIVSSSPSKAFSGPKRSSGDEGDASKTWPEEMASPVIFDSGVHVSLPRLMMTNWLTRRVKEHLLVVVKLASYSMLFSSILCLFIFYIISNGLSTGCCKISDNIW